MLHRPCPATPPRLHGRWRATRRDGRVDAGPSTARTTAPGATAVRPSACVGHRRLLRRLGPGSGTIAGLARHLETRHWRPYASPAGPQALERRFLAAVCTSCTQAGSSRLHVPTQLGLGASRWNRTPRCPKLIRVPRGRGSAKPSATATADLESRTPHERSTTVSVDLQ